MRLFFFVLPVGKGESRKQGLSAWSVTRVSLLVPMLKIVDFQGLGSGVFFFFPPFPSFSLSLFFFLFL